MNHPSCLKSTNWTMRSYLCDSASWCFYSPLPALPSAVSSKPASSLPGIECSWHSCLKLTFFGTNGKLCQHLNLVFVVYGTSSLGSRFQPDTAFRCVLLSSEETLCSGLTCWHTSANVNILSPQGHSSVTIKDKLYLARFSRCSLLKPMKNNCCNTCC